MLKLERVHAAVPIDTDMVIAIQLGESREEGIFFEENLFRHQRSDGVRRHESAPVLRIDLRVALGTASIADFVPGGKANLVFIVFGIGARAEPFDNKSEIVLCGVLRIVAFPIKNDEAKVVFHLVAAFHVLDIEGINRAYNLGIALEELIPRVIRPLRRLNGDLEVADIFVRAV